MALFGSKKNTKAPAKKKAAPRAKKAPAASVDAMGRLERMIGSPGITDKATYAIGRGCYVFVVPQDATKSEVAKAISIAYKVIPRKVNIVSMAPRKTVSRVRGRRGTSPGLKKAYVYLNKDDKIEII